MATPHNEAQKEEISKNVILTGDPNRATFIAQNYLENYKCVNKVRGIYAYTGYYKGTKVTIMAHGMGIPNSICKAIAPPKISAKDVEMEAKTAVANMGFETQAGVYFVAASDRQRPVTIPKWATLCCKIMSIMVDKVTTHKRA